MASGKPAKQHNRSEPSAEQLDAAQDRATNLRLAPLTPEQAIRGMFKIKPADVKRIVASKPGNKKKKE